MEENSRNKGASTPSYAMCFQLQKPAIRGKCCLKRCKGVGPHAKLETSSSSSVPNDVAALPQLIHNQVKLVIHGRRRMPLEVLSNLKTRRYIN